MNNTISKDLLHFWMRSLLVLCFLSFSLSGWAQPVRDWDRGYGGEGFEDCNAAVQTNDSGYLLGGITDSDPSGDIMGTSQDIISLPWWFPNQIGDFWAVRTDEDGALLWEARFGGDREDRMWAILETTDGGALMGGVSYSDSLGDRTDATRGHADYWIVKTDDMGQKEWDRAYGGDSTDILNVMIKTQDGGYMLGGWSMSSGWNIGVDSLGEKSEPSRGGFDWWVVKIDAVGNVQWEKTYGGNDLEELADIVQKDDGSYLIAGGTRSTISGEVDSVSRGDGDFWLLHIDASGNKLNEYRYGGIDYDYINRVIVSSDGNYVLAGSSYTQVPSGDKTDPGFGIFDWWIMKIDVDGNILWQHTFGGSDIENVYSLSQNSVDHYLLGGFTRSTDGTLADNANKGGNDFWIIYMDPNGNVLWDELYGGDDAESLEQAFQTEDGGYLLTGHSRTDVNQDKTDPTNGNNDFWIVKTLCDINVELNDTIVCPNQEILLSAYDPNCLDCTYNWSDIGITADSIRSITTDQQVSYAVTLTDGVGCLRSDEIIVDVYEDPVVDLGANQQICEGESIPLDAGDDGATYEWNNGAAEQIITVDSNYTYAVTVTNSDGCVVEDSMTLVVNPMPEVELGNDTSLCDGNSIFLNAALPGASYNWSTSENSPFIEVSTTDNYSVTITDGNSCTAEDVVNVTFLPLPQPVALSNLDPGPHCPGSSFTIDLQNTEHSVLYELFDDQDTLIASTIGDGNDYQFFTDPVYTSTQFTVVATSTGLCADTLDNFTIVNIGDVELPVVDCRSDTAFTIQDGDCNPDLSLNASVIATDNCGIENITYTLSGATTGNSPADGIHDASDVIYNIGLTTVMYTVVDSFGNAATCSFNVEVIDLNQPLSGTNALDMIVECDGAGNTVAFNNWLANNGGATASVACSPLNWTTIPENPVLSDDCGETGFVEVTFVAADTSGNTISSVASFTIVDTQPPTFTVPADITIGPNDDPADLTLTGDVTDESDGCDSGVDDLGPRIATFTDEVMVNDCNDIITRTWSLIDECGNLTEAIQTITQNFPPPTAGVFGDTSICAGDTISLTFDLNGTSGNFNITYNDGDQDYDLFGISDGYTIEVQPSSSTTYSIVSVVDISRLNCEGQATEEAVVEVFEAPQVINVSEACDFLNTSYVITFEITGGDSDSYVVNGDAGVLNGNTFESLTIPVDSSYTFYIDDGNGCGPIEVSGTYACPCITETGAILNPSLTGCGTASVEADHDNSILDGNDLIEFIMHDGDANTIGPNIFSNTNAPVFSIQPGMIYGQTYFITIQAGTDDGNGNVNVNDACFVQALGVPIIFYEPPSAVIDVLTDTELDCIETSLQLSAANSTGQGILDYEWTTDVGQIVGSNLLDLLTLDETGIYTLTVSDQATGCTASEAIEITADDDIPMAVIEIPDFLTCIDTLITLDASGSSTGNNYVYEWSGGVIVNGANTLMPTVNVSAMYTLIVTDTLNGCTSDEQIFVDTNYDAPDVDAGLSQQLDCVTTELTLNGNYTSNNGGTNIQWSANPGNIVSGATMLNPVIDEAGIYTLQVTDSETGCIGTSSVSITIDPGTPQGALFELIDPICFGDQNGSIAFVEVLGGTAPFEYSVDGISFSENDEFLNLPEGVYPIIIQDSLGCTWDTTINLQAPPQLWVELGDNFEIELGDSVQLHAQLNRPVDTFFWNFDYLLSLDPSVMPTQQTGYGIEVIDENGCVAEDFIVISVDKDRNVYIPNAFSPNDDGLNDRFVIYADESVAVIHNFQIFDRWGELVFAKNNYEFNILQEGWDGRFKGRESAEGVYVYYAEIEFVDGLKRIYKGDLTLLR